MSELIREISLLDVPEDLLRQVNIEGLIDDFRKNFKRLDDFKKTRNLHEQRNFISKWWNSDQLEKAQLDAVETQAAFSKAIGQLMVLSIVQSQQLQSQQKLLTLQQQSIKLQTERIEEHTSELHDQQLLLVKQNKDLEKLVNHYFELRGLTQEGAKKLIAIANDVQETRDELIRSVDESLNAESRRLDCALEEVDQKILSLEGHVSHQTNVVNEHYEKVSGVLRNNEDKWESLIANLHQATDSTNARVDGFDDEVTEQRAILNEFGLGLAHQKKAFDVSTTDVLEKIKIINNDFAIYRKQAHGQITKLYFGLGMLAVGLVGTILFAFTRI
ncbi:MAG: hypothetical protein KGM99_13410 [Burkholderiales bacterium]|nr:hypothetical protein [Burkholderiales bacterium]